MNANYRFFAGSSQLFTHRAESGKLWVWARDLLTNVTRELVEVESLRESLEFTTSFGPT